MKRSFGSVIGLLAVAAALMMWPGAAVSGGGQPTPQELFDASVDELGVLLTDLNARVDEVVDDTIIDLTGRQRVEIATSKKLKMFSSAAAKIEKDCTKTSGQMQRVIDKLIVRLERAEADPNLIDDAQGLGVYFEDARYSVPANAIEEIYEAYGEYLGVIP